MNRKRRIEIFSAGCPTCERSIRQIRAAACPSCEITILDTRSPAIAARAQGLGIRSLPAVVIDGTLAACCSTRVLDIATLQATGLGQA